MQNQPLDKGRACVIAEKFPTKEMGQNGQPVMKNRYATVGRATMWPNQNGGNQPNIDIEIDTIPLGVSGPMKLYIFWDSEQNNQQAPQQPQQQYAQPQQQYTPPHGGYGSK